MLKHVIKTGFKSEWNKLVWSEPLLFSDFMPMIIYDKEGGQKTISGVYAEVSDKEALKL